MTIYMTNRSLISLLMGIIWLEHLELFALELEKNAEFDFVYTLASTNINRWAPNLVETYVTIRSRMSCAIYLLRTEHLELSALELEKKKKRYKWLCLHSSNCKHRPVSTKLGQNMYDQQISNEFYYESTWTGTTWVICSWIRKIAEFDLVYTLASTNIN